MELKNGGVGMFGGKTQNGAAPAVPAVPSGLQMLLKSMGFDPAAFLQNVANMMAEIHAARTDFIARFDGLKAGQVELYAQQKAAADPVLAAIREQGAAQCARLDALIAQAEDNNRRTREALEEIQRCLKEQKQPQRRR
jgi:hypothetical protein